MSGRKGFLAALLSDSKAKDSQSNQASEIKAPPFVPTFPVEPFKFVFSTKQQQTSTLPFELTPVPSSNAAITTMLGQSVPQQVPGLLPASDFFPAQPMSAGQPLYAEALQPAPPLPLLASNNTEEELALESRSNFSDRKPIEFIWKIKRSTKPGESKDRLRTQTPVAGKYTIRNQSGIPPHIAFVAQNAINNGALPKPRESDQITAARDVALMAQLQSQSQSQPQLEPQYQPSLSALPRERTEDDDYAEAAAEREAWVNNFLSQPRS